MLLNGYAGYSAYLVCSTDAEWLPSLEMEDTHWSLDQANGSDTLFSREGVRDTVYHRFSDLHGFSLGNSSGTNLLVVALEFPKESPKEPVFDRFPGSLRTA